MKNLFAFVCIAVAALLIGCGGGGGGDSTTGTTTAGVSGIRVEARLSTDSTQVVDLDNIQVGDVLQLRLWGRRDSDNAIVEVPSTSWKTDASATALTVTNAGVLTANGPLAGGAFHLYANGTSYSATFTIKAVQARVTGLVRNDIGQGATRAHLFFYNGAGTVVGSAYTGSNGTFAASVPPGAKTFLVDLTERADSYYNQFGFGVHDYNMSCSTRAPLPLLSSGGTFALVSPTGGPIGVYLIVAGSPPPPPPDCGLGGG